MSVLPAVELEVADLCTQGDFTAAASLVLKAYGGETMQFLLSRSRDPQVATEAFSAFSEDVLRGIPGFAFRSSLRTWVYALAYHALARTSRASAKLRSREALRAEFDSGQASAVRERSETPPYLRTDMKQRLLALRERLPEADATLLELRVSRRFSWKDIARVLNGSENELHDELVTKEAARLRKRFQLASASLREMARAEGLIDDS